MSLAQVQAAIALVAALVLSWSGLLIAVAAALPGRTGRAEAALLGAPRRCAVAGVGALALAVVALLLLQAPRPILKLAGAALLLLLAAVMTIGAAGLAQLMGRRIGEM